MFTGIVAGTGVVASVRDEGGVSTIEIEAPVELLAELQTGASVSVDGACLTVVARPAADRARFDIVAQSLAETTLGGPMKSRRVNLERAVRVGEEVGGHQVSGHVDFTTSITTITDMARNRTWRLTIPSPFEHYLFDRGFVALDGCSLTISRIERTEGWFEVCLIPETRRSTILDAKVVGDRVNVEIDRVTQVVVDTVRSVLAEGACA